MYKIRLISSESCKICSYYKKVLARYNVSYELYDADNKDNQKELDSWRISQMPVIQIINDNKVVYQFPPGQPAPRQMDLKIKMLEKEEKKC